MAPVLVTACMARLARLTPSSREMSAAAAVAAIERHTRAAALGLSAGEGARITWADDGVEDDDELGDAFWDGDAAWINYIAHPTNHVRAAAEPPISRAVCGFSDSQIRTLRDALPKVYRIYSVAVAMFLTCIDIEDNDPSPPGWGAISIESRATFCHCNRHS